MRRINTKQVLVLCYSMRWWRIDCRVSGTSHSISNSTQHLSALWPAVVWWASANSQMLTPVSGHARVLRHLRCLVFLFALFFLSINFFCVPTHLFLPVLCLALSSHFLMVMVCVLTSICPWGAILPLLLPSLNSSWCYFYIASFLLLSLVWLLIHRCSSLTVSSFLVPLLFFLLASGCPAGKLCYSSFSPFTLESGW